jgi:Ca2+-binding RTX toxin-like protein
MTVTISVNSTAGANINYGATNYLDTVNDNFNPMTGRFGYFYNSFTNASQYGLATTDDSDADTIIDDGNGFIAGGNMTYNLGTNVLSGSIDTLAFGDNVNGVSTTTPGITSGAMSIGTAAFTITSLAITGTTATDNTHQVLYNLMNGDESFLENYLASQSVVFQGNSGNDGYQAGSQADTLNGNAGNDTLAGGGGTDTISGGDGNDTVLGEAGNDSIDAGKGTDLVAGGAGTDSLTGGDNADTFAFASATDSLVATFDTITDFVSGTDLIDLGWDFVWTDDVQVAGDVFYDDGRLYGRDQNDNEFSIAVGTVIEADLV